MSINSKSITVTETQLDGTTLYTSCYTQTVVVQLLDAQALMQHRRVFHHRRRARWDPRRVPVIAAQLRHVHLLTPRGVESRRPHSENQLPRRGQAAFEQTQVVHASRL